MESSDSTELREELSQEATSVGASAARAAAVEDGNTSKDAIEAFSPQEAQGATVSQPEARGPCQQDPKFPPVQDAKNPPLWIGPPPGGRQLVGPEGDPVR